MLNRQVGHMLADFIDVWLERIGDKVYLNIKSNGRNYIDLKVFLDLFDSPIGCNGASVHLQEGKFCTSAKEEIGSLLAERDYKIVKFEISDKLFDHLKKSNNGILKITITFTHDFTGVRLKSIIRLCQCHLEASAKV
jgi:hypothetical protein